MLRGRSERRLIERWGLGGSAKPMSGRMVAAALVIAPTTATAVLAKLREAGFATSSRQGRADRWRLNTDNSVVRSWLEEARAEPTQRKPIGDESVPHGWRRGHLRAQGRRPIPRPFARRRWRSRVRRRSTGGRRGLSASTRAPGRRPRHPRRSHRRGGPVTGRRSRRAPLTRPCQSDESAGKAHSRLRARDHQRPVDGPEHRVALVVAGTQEHAKQLAWLADLAAKQIDAPSFFGLVRTPGKFVAAVRERLDHIEALVRLALIDLGVADPGIEIVQQRTWELLAAHGADAPTRNT